MYIVPCEKECHIWWEIEEKSEENCVKSNEKEICAIVFVLKSKRAPV